MPLQDAPLLRLCHLPPAIDTALPEQSPLIGHRSAGIQLTPRRRAIAIGTRAEPRGDVLFAAGIISGSCRMTPCRGSCVSVHGARLIAAMASAYPASQRRRMPPG